jgi:hypothetical protein
MMLCRVLVQECALFREGEVGRSCYDDEKRVWDWTLEGQQLRGVVVGSISSRRTLVPPDYSLCRRVGHDCDHVNHRETDMHAETKHCCCCGEETLEDRLEAHARDASSELQLLH